MKNIDFVKILKTKQGIWAIICAALSIFSIFAWISGEVPASSGLLGFVVFLGVALLLFWKGATAPAPKKDDFQPTKNVGNYFWIDDVHKQFCLTSDKKKRVIYNYSDIMDYELISDENTVTSSSLGNAVVGGLLFGGIGALVGSLSGETHQKNACSRLQINIKLNNINTPVIFVKLLTCEATYDSSAYQTASDYAAEIIAILHFIKNENV